MLIEIDDSKTIADIQDRFSLCFPYLKIEFYNKPHHWEESTAAKYLIDPATFIRDIRKKHAPGIVEIKSWHKTGDVEQLFKKLFGLNAQIFRLEDNRWKQSAESDNLTLAMQTEIAMNKKS
jgi:hypothetical protein